ncbi:HlyD family secretion protein [Acinetobacter sp.]|mgnify:CR=1 FL=1|uniref:HlyD family secretion protein n=1 Tax=Acinetobacter sp. TaxID=472 RepID=UPI0038910054
MTQDQNKPDQDVENASSEGSSTNTSAPTTQVDTQATSEQQANTDNAFFSYSEQAQSTEDTAPNPKKSAVTKMVGIVVLILLLGLIAFGLWKSYQPKQVELQGRVEAGTIYVSTKVPSRIEEVYVHEGDKVTKGQELVRLFSPEVDTKRQQALASLQAALALQSTVDRGSQQENIETLYATWQSLKAQQTLAQATYRRGATLFKEGVISRQRRDEMQAAAASATQMAEAAYQQYKRAKRGSTPEQKSSADAQVEIAKAAVKEANSLEAETKLHSPINGIVSKTYGKASELVVTGVPIVSLIQDNDLWVSLDVREDLYAQVYKSKTIEGFIPALNQTATFKIKNIDVEGEFATLKTTRQTGGYDIRSFKFHLTPIKPIAALKVGMSVLFKIKEPK